MFHADKVFLATAYPQSELVGTMKRLLACLALCASLSASAQVVYPYNPDANGDSAITSGDLLDFLPVFATTYTPLEITIDGVPLDEWLSNLESVVNSNAASIESLFAMQSQINALEIANDNLQSQINALQNQLNNLTFSVDGLPPCIDLDNDGVCDFADACPGVAVSFSFAYLDTNYEVMVGESLVAGGTYWYALLSGLEAPSACLIGTSLHTANLSGANLSGANLEGADLSSATLNNVNLSGANLSGANIEGANIEDADLSSANLIGANLNNADLWGTNLSSANLSSATLNIAELTNVNLSDANLDGATMTCLQGCPSQLPLGYICEPDPDCSEPYSYRIVPE